MLSQRLGNKVLLLLVILLAVSVRWIVAIENKVGLQTLPRFEWAELPKEIAPKVGEVKFGYLTIPENRSDSNNSKVIKLPVMIAKSRSKNPRPDPIIFTVGGPGVITTLGGGRDLSQLRFLDERDFIYFEQRGAKYSIPTLIGPEIDSVMIDAIDKNLNGKPDDSEVVKAATKLKARLLSEGIDLTAYSTRESAADIEDLRKALKIEKWNLYGISYGCRLMLEVMRNYPEGIRSVILDSPLPPDVGWDETSMERYWNNLHKLFASCRDDSVINLRYPNLESRFLYLIEEADNNPIGVQVEHPISNQLITVKLNGEGIFLLAANYMGNGSYIYSFPYSMNLICEKNPEILSYLLKGLIAPPPFAWGMVYSIWCNEEFPFEDFDRFHKHKDLPKQLAGISMTIMPEEIFDFWPRRTPDPVDNQPVKSELPVLVTNGQYDPDTPPEWGKRVCQTLPNVQYLEFPGQSHLPLFNHPCGPAMAVEFFNNPDKKLDTGCLEKYPFRFYSE